MIEKWELAHFPFAKDARRYKARIRGSENDIRDLIQKIPVTCGRPFVTLSQNYNWAFYLYAVSDSVRSQVIEAFNSFCSEGQVIESPTLDVDKELPPMLEDVLEAAAKSLIQPRDQKAKVPASPAEGNDPEKGPEASPEPVDLPESRPVREILKNETFELGTTVLNSQYIFSEFIVGPNNRFTHAAAQAVAENPGKIYNPFFIYGGVGLGKTHLMQAIGHAMIARDPKIKSLFISTEKFMTAVIEAIRGGSINQLRSQYRTLDLLLIDDIHFLSDSESTQEEFFHVFNNLHEVEKQIVITSDRPPKLLSTLEDRLRSRFEWGLITDLKMPTLETRVAILEKKLSTIQLKLSDDHIRFIAEHAKSNIRELEGIVKKIHAHVNLMQGSVDLNYLTGILGVERPEKPNVAIEQPKVAVEKVIPTPIPPSPPPIPEPAPPVPSSLSKNQGLKEDSPAQENSRIETDKAGTPSKEVPSTSPSDSVAKESEKEKQPVSQVQPVANPSETSPVKTEEEPDLSLRPVEIICFYPKGKENEFGTVKNKFNVIMKKHKLKIRLSRLAEITYEYEGNLDYTLFVQGCKSRNCPNALVLGPPPTPILTEDDFAGILSTMLEDEKISLQFIPWSEFLKDYRYLNCALDFSLLAPISDGSK